MIIQYLEVNGFKDFFLSSEARNEGEMSRETEINNEGSGFWVHASGEHDIDQEFLFFKMVSIINDTIIDDLSYQANWGLGTILIKIWHVKVIHEVDKDLTWWWTEGTSSSLVDLRFDDNLKCFGIGVRVEVDGSVDDAFLIKSGEVISDDSGLTSTGGSDIDHTFSGLDMHVEEESLSGGLGGWDDEAAEKSIELGVHWLYRLLPMLPVTFNWVEEVVEALTVIWELDLGDSLELVTEGKLVLVEGSTIGPHGSEDEETIIDVLDIILLVLLSQFLEVVVLGLDGMEIAIELIDNGGQTGDLSHIADWGNVGFMLQVVQELVVDVG